MKFLRALPPTDYCHYSNPDSQGSFVVATRDWPVDTDLPTHSYTNDFSTDFCKVKPKRSKVPFGYETYEAIVPEGLKCTSTYSDRLPPDRYEAGRSYLNTGCQGWCSALKRTSNNGIKEFAAAIFGMNLSQIYAVRVIHCYNVATGYSCPIIETLYTP